MILECLRTLALGMMGIFAVMGVIIASVWMLNRISGDGQTEGKRDKRDKR